MTPHRSTVYPPDRAQHPGRAAQQRRRVQVVVPLPGPVAPHAELDPQLHFAPELAPTFLPAPRPVPADEPPDVYVTRCREACERMRARTVRLHEGIDVGELAGGRTWEGVADF